MTPTEILRAQIMAQMDSRTCFMGGADQKWAFFRREADKIIALAKDEPAAEREQAAADA